MWLQELQLSRHWMALVPVLVGGMWVRGSYGGNPFPQSRRSRTTPEFPKHWQGERAWMLCCDPQIPGVWLEDAGSPERGLP